MQSRTRLIIPRLFSTNTKTTHFGFKTVHVEDKKPMVADVFHGVADQYDLMNDAMSAGIHRLWKDEFVNMLSPRPNQPGLPQFRILDVAGGTGDIAFRMASALQKTGINEMYSNQEQDDADIVVCDINSSMLRVGKDRAIQKGFGPNTRPKLDWIEGDAEKLPFESESFDAYTIAFGIRNVTDVQKALEEAHRVLRRGGRFMCLEFSHVENPLFKSVYDAFSFNVIPQLGQCLANDRDSYQYLVESIRKFPPQNEFKRMIETAGFKSVRYTNLTLGVAAIHSGFKL